MIHALLVALVCFAPAPFPKTQSAQKSPYEAIQGDWRFDWGSTVFKARFAPGGRWECYTQDGSSLLFVGQWSVDVRRKLIYVRETGMSNSHTDSLTWPLYAFPMDGKCEDGEGLKYGGVQVKLSKQ